MRLQSEGSQSRHFLQSAGQIAVGTLIAQALLLAVIPFVTRLATPQAFGVFGLLVSVASFIAVFSTMRLEVVLPTIKGNRDAIRLAQAAVLLSTVVAVALGICVSASAPQIGHLLGIPAPSALAFVPLLVLSFASYAVVRALCVRHEHFATIGWAQVYRSLTIVGAWFVGFSAMGTAWSSHVLLLGQFLGEVVFAIAMFAGLGARRRIQALRFDLKPLRRSVLAYRTTIRTLLVSQSMAAIYSRLPLVTVAGVFGIAEAGYFALAERIVSVPAALLATAIGDVYRQRAAALHHAGQEFSVLFRNVVLGSAAIAIPTFFIAMYLTAHHLAQILGPAWAGAEATLLLLLAGAAVAFVASTVDKTSLIVEANSYIVWVNAFRLLYESALAVCALSGVMSYLSYVAFHVCGRIAVYLCDMALGWRWASAAGR